MNIVPLVKTCKKCNTEKPITDFYKHSQSADGRMNACALCYGAQQKARRAQPGYRAKTKGEAQNDYEGLFIQYLRSQGIYAAPGKSSEWKWIDAVAWGCVKVELKSGRGTSKTEYQFTFSPKQTNETFKCDIICLMCINEDNEASYHLFPSDHPVFFTLDGKRKKGIGYSPGVHIHKHKRRIPVSLNDTIMKQHRDNVGLIEKIRYKIYLELKGEVYDADRNILYREDQLKLVGF